jgi:hypothetical protein
MTNLQLDLSPSEFFRSQIHDAASELRISLDDHLEFYLVNLLCEYISSSKLIDPTDKIDALSTPLALMLQKAIEAPPERRAKIFKNLGDTSLYFAGFFQDYFNRKIYSISYYISMGQTAYTSLATELSDHNGRGDFSQMYKTLASRFNQLVEILGTVAAKNEAGSANPGLLEIYDRWNQTDSESLRKKLNDAGIAPLHVSRKAQ